jgi:putative hydrolases of HD superfamily
MEQDIGKIFEFLKIARQYQLVLRATPHKDGRMENDAEHSWSVAFICMLLASRLEKEFGVKLDQARMLKMALIHDFAEIETGDTKTWDTTAREGKVERERVAIENLFKDMPEDLRTELTGLIAECEEKKTLEAKIVKSIDRLDPPLHRTAFRIGWEGCVEDDHATVSALDARQLPRHEFSQILTDLYKTIRDEAVEYGLFKVS